MNHGIADTGAVETWRSGASASSSRRILRNGLLVAGVVALALAFRDLIQLPFRTAPQLEGAEELFFEPGGSSPGLVLLIAAWMFVRRWPRFRASLGTGGGAGAGTALLGAGGSIAAWAHYVGVPELGIPGLVLALLGGACLAGGAAGARAVRLPILFLLFAMPLPGIALNHVVYPLQIATANCVGAILNAVGVGALVSGDRVISSGTVFQVIESCSGLRGTRILLLSALVYLELFPRPLLHSVVLIALTPVVGFLINLGRALSIVVNPYSDLSTVHTLQGMIMMSLGVLSLAGIDRVLRRVLPRRPTAPRLPARPPAGPPALAGAATFAIAAGLLAVAVTAVTPWSPEHERPGRALAALPPEMGPWRAEALPLDRQFLGSVGYSGYVRRRYRNGDDTVDVLLLEERRLDPRRSLISPKLAVPQSGWGIASELGDARTSRAVIAERVGERRLVELSYLGADSVGREALFSLLGLDRSYLRRGERLAALQLSTPIGSGPAAVADGRGRLDEFRAAASGPLAVVLTGQRPD